ncbi:serine hydrolase [Saccharothrix sp. NRRL B-16348]|uniref:serine hydrolase n=1 Tax=Saccharothrix sp. NRRL B-16348 TaxID=1415542 RepID=UPI000A85FE4E|nr:serine hydrolase [Saccharothrix sp. NRRL B-16348]
MGRRWWVVAVAVIAGVVASVGQSDTECAAQSSAAPPSAASTSAETPRPAAPRAAEAPAPDLSAAVARAVEVAGGVDLGLAVVDLETGAAAGHHADVPFPSASLSKLVVAVDMLTSGEAPAADLDRLRRALSLSDDEAMNALWTWHDGMGAVDRVAAQVGLTATRAPADASQWGDVEMSAGDVTSLYRHIVTDLPAAHRDFIVSALSAASPTAADGFDQAYGLLAPGTDAYAKQGWMWYLPADFHLHSAGVVADRYAVAALSIQPGVAEQAAKDLLTAVTSTLVAALTDQSG